MIRTDGTPMTAEETDDLVQAVEATEAKQIAAGMKAHRTLIRVINVSERHVDVVIPGWRSYHTVSVPLECIAEELRGVIASGTYLLGDVNIGAVSDDQLFFHNVNEIAPPPKTDLA